VGRDVWFQQDIQHTLVAARSAQVSQPARREPSDTSAGRECEAFRVGFQAAPQSIALAIGIALDIPRVGALRQSGRGRLRRRASGETYESSVFGASEAMYE